MTSINSLYVIPLRHGTGNGNPKDGLCLVQMVDWFAGSERVTDHPECASPGLSKFAIYLNDDAPSQEKRNELWPLVWRLLGSADDAAEIPRIEHLMRRPLAPLFSLGRDGLLGKAQRMEEIKITADMIATAAAWPVGEARAEARRVAREATMGGATAAVAAAWEISREIFIEAIELGPHGEEDPIFTPRAEQLCKILEPAE